MKKVLFFIVISVVITLKSLAQYADLGGGPFKDQIWWFDWNGLGTVNAPISSNATRNFLTDDGLFVTVTFSNVINGPHPTAMNNTWGGSVLLTRYNFTNTAIMPALYNFGNSNNVSFTMSISATRNGSPSPFKLIAADAEASITEITSLTTNGSNWTMFDFYRNSTQTINPLTGCNTQVANIIQTYGGSSGFGQNPIISTESTSGNLQVDVFLDKQTVTGGMAVAFGIFAPVDRGDLPNSYGSAQHLLPYSSGTCPTSPTTGPTISQIVNLKLGTVAPDADGTQSLDDNLIGLDEDGLNAPFPNYTGNGSYSLVMPVSNTTGSNAFLTGWFDYNRNGVFDNNESTTVTVANGATSSTLTWTGLPAALPQVISTITDFGFRFRLSSNQSATQNSTGFAPDGEVEDYLVPIETSCPEDCYWTLNGNNSTNNNFLGTLNNQNLRIKTNNTDRVIITGNSGNVGIGLGSGNLPNAKLHVDNASIPNTRLQNLPLTKTSEYVYIDANGFLYKSRRSFGGIEVEDADLEIENAINELRERINTLQSALSKCGCGEFVEYKTIEKKSKSSIVNINPNPSNNTTLITYSLSAENLRTAEIRLMNSQGVLIKSNKITNIKGIGNWSLSEPNLPSGSYIVLLLVNEQVADSKVLIKTK